MSDQDTGIKRAIDPTKFWWVYDDMMYAVSGAVDFENEGTFGVIANQGGAIKYTSGATAGNRARLNQSVTMLPYDPTKTTRCNIIGGTLQIVQVDHFIGMFSALPTAANPPVEPANGIYFRRIDVAGAANWFAVCRKGGVETAVDTGLLGDLLQHGFKIRVENAIAYFYIDDVKKATISTNVPVVALFAGLVAVTTEAVAKADFISAFDFFNSLV